MLDKFAAAIAALLALSACQVVPEPATTVDPVSQNSAVCAQPSLTDDRANAEEHGFRVVDVLLGRDAQEFARATGYPDYAEVFSALRTLDPSETRAVIGLYDNAGCRLTVGVFPASVLGIRGA